MGSGNIAGKRTTVKAGLGSGETFTIVELLDPRDSELFKGEMRGKGLRDLTPPVEGNTFRSKAPTEDWLKQVASLDPDWWYISGHFTRTPQYEALGKTRKKKKPFIPLFPKKKERWRLVIKSTHTILQGGLTRAPLKPAAGSFGIRVNTRREIEIIVENATFKGSGKISLISIKPYSNPPGYCSCRQIPWPVAGSGTDEEDTEYELARHASYKIGDPNWDPARAGEALAREHGVQKTPFCFPETYSVKVRRAPPDRLVLVSESAQVYDQAVGYVVSVSCKPSPRGSQFTIDRFVFPPVEVKLKDGWYDKYNYSIRVRGRTHTDDYVRDWLACPDGAPSSSRNNTDEIQVELIERLIDGSTDAGFFNLSYYNNEFLSKQQSDPNSWRIRMEYVYSRDELKTENFFEKYGRVSYRNARVVLLVGCNTLVLGSVREYLSELFPNAVILGHIHNNPTNATPIIRNFLGRYFSKPAKANDWNHIVSSWLSYHEIRSVKNSIEERGYGLAALYQGKVHGIDIDKTNPAPKELAKDGQTIQRLRLQSIRKHPKIVDVWLVWNSKGDMVTHKGFYEGDTKPADFMAECAEPYSNPGSFPFLTTSNLIRNRGY